MWFIFNVGMVVTHSIRVIGDFSSGDLDVKVNNDYVLSIQLLELNQNKPEFQKGLKGELVSAIESAFKLGKKYENNRIKNLLG